MKLVKKIMIATALLISGAAQAAHVTTLAGSTSFDFGPPFDLMTGGPQAVAPGITWSSDSPSSVYGWTGSAGGYGFAANGRWNMPMIGTNTPTGTMTIDFATAIAGVGAFLNWSMDSNGGPVGAPAVIAIYNSSDVLLESYTLTFGPFGGDAIDKGEFHGFFRDTADISSMTFTGAFIGAAGLEVVAGSPGNPSNPIPLPGSLALLSLGLLGLGCAARRRQH